MMRRWWEIVRRPTLVRRLMLAQVLMLSVVWSLAVAFVLIEGTDEDSSISHGVLRAIANVADNLADQPQRQHESLRAMDEALRASGRPASSTRLGANGRTSVRSDAWSR